MTIQSYSCPVNDELTRFRCNHGLLRMGYAVLSQHDQTFVSNFPIFQHQIKSNHVHRHKYLHGCMYHEAPCYKQLSGSGFGIHEYTIQLESFP